MAALAKHASKEGVGAYQAKFLIKGLSLYKVFQRPFFALRVRMVFGLQPSHLVFFDEVAAKTNKTRLRGRRQRDKHLHSSAPWMKD
jgi:hypothetical protein